MNITLFTSGSTDEPKQVCHSNISPYIQRSIDEIGLTSSDTVLDVFPANTIAHYTVTTLPAIMSGAHLVSTNFDPYNYIRLFNEIRPTYISLIPRHYDILSKTKEWKTFDMSCVRYMVTGSSNITQEFIDAFKNRGVKTVANWYGMTEVPPPVMIGYDTPYFTKINEDVSFSKDGECIINGWHTGDIFDVRDKIKFLHRKDAVNGKTWKTHV